MQANGVGCRDVQNGSDGRDDGLKRAEAPLSYGTGEGASQQRTLRDVRSGAGGRGVVEC